MMADEVAYRLAADPVLWDFWDGEPPLAGERPSPTPDINYARYHRAAGPDARPFHLAHRLAEGIYV